jgi:hypothetical protein
MWSIFVDKTMKKAVKFSNNLVSEDKCEISQAIPHNSSVSEVNSSAERSPQYSGIRRAGSHCYKTIGEYLGKKFIDTDVEIMYEVINCASSSDEGEAADSLALPVDKGSEIRSVGDDTKTRKSQQRIHATELLPKLSVERKRSGDLQLPSKPDVKRPCSSGGEAADLSALSVAKGSNVRYVGNGVKTRQSRAKTHETEVLSETVSHVATDDGQKDHESASLTCVSVTPHTSCTKQGDSCELHLRENKGNRAGKSNSLPKSNEMLTEVKSKGSCNISPSAVDHNQSQSCAELGTHTSNSGEPSSAGGSQSSFRYDQLPNGRLNDNSLTTNLSQSVISPQTSRSTNDILDVVGVPASHTSPENGVRETERLGIPCPKIPDPESMRAVLNHMEQYIYELWQGTARMRQVWEALSSLVGSSQATERQQYQQQPFGVPLPNDVSWNTNSLRASLLACGRRPSLGSEENINSSQQQSFASGESVASVGVTQHTAGTKTATHTASDDTYVRGVGTSISTRHTLVGDRLHQNPSSNPLQAQESSSELQSHSKSDPQVPQFVPAGKKIIPSNLNVPEAVPADNGIIPPNPNVP